MGEATKDKQSSQGGSSEDKHKTKGWIRLHSDESAKVNSADEPKDDVTQSSDYKVRKLEKPPIA